MFILRKKKIIAMVFPFVFLSMTYCSRDHSTAPGSGQLEFRHGTSFGECRGYCKTELIVRRNNVTLIRSSWNEVLYPQRIKSGRLPEQEWLLLVRSYDWVEISSLPDVIGCPDCFDQGAEWVEVRSSSQSKRVTFEYGAVVEGIEDLTAALRLIDQTLHQIAS